MPVLLPVTMTTAMILPGGLRRRREPTTRMSVVRDIAGAGAQEYARRDSLDLASNPGRLRVVRRLELRAGGKTLGRNLQLPPPALDVRAVDPVRMCDVP